MCWGDSTNGQMGAGYQIGSLLRTNAIGVSSLVVSISAGAEHNCALLDNGSTSCWGKNTCGQLGNSGTSTGWVPTSPVGNGTISITSGTSHVFRTNDNSTLCGVRHGRLRNGLNSSSSTRRCQHLTISQPSVFSPEVITHAQYQRTTLFIVGDSILKDSWVPTPQPAQTSPNR